MKNNLFHKIIMGYSMFNSTVVVQKLVFEFPVLEAGAISGYRIWFSIETVRLFYIQSRSVDMMCYIL